ncbi:DUF6221 family protein [Streptomyces sp. CA-106110]|uniref:DUF6221 family protein n=1 Tax=Streptomyces sp. CA-106110 TaxID=3240044 RepID=UPI003D906F87
MKDALLAFLRARLDEDDETARKAIVRRTGGEAWSYEGSAVLAQGGMVIAERIVPVLGEHIARYDPARVRRQTAVLRDRVDLWSRMVGSHARVCLRAVAAIWADHPDYREEWKPYDQ